MTTRIGNDSCHVVSSTAGQPPADLSSCEGMRWVCLQATRLPAYPTDGYGGSLIGGGAAALGCELAYRMCIRDRR